MHILDIYDRVTSVIGAFLDFSNIPEGVLENKCEIGSLTHSFIADKLLGRERSVIPDECVGYLASFQKFINSFSRDWDLSALEVETRLYDKENLITGALDVIVKDKDGRTLIIDWKTSASTQKKSWDLQGAAYASLAIINGYKEVEPPIFVRLKKDGSNPFVYRKDDYAEDIQMFQECLNVYRYFDLGKKKSSFGDD